MSKDGKTPMLDELEKGAWPSFVKEIKKSAKKSNTAQDLLNILERSYRDKVTHWKHGGIVGVLGYGGGVIGRYCDLPEEYPGVAHFHTVRINQPAGFYYTSAALRELMDIWDKYGSGLTNFHGSTGDLVLLGTQTGNDCKGLGPRRFRFLPPHPELLRGHVPLRVRQHRHDGDLRYPHP
jgi:dissimilatory sulfite reductase alpha subunit